MIKKPEIAILGAGPAGLTAALQLRRQGYNPLLLEKEQTGGLLLNANLVENYPGFPGGISGPELMEKFLQQAAWTGVVITPGDVCLVKYTRDKFQIETCRETYSADIVLTATGTEPKPFHDPHLSPGVEKSVYAEVFPLLKESGKRMGIIGAGDAALDYALNLAKKNEVVILNRGRQIKGLPLLWSRVQAEDKIRYYADHQVIDVKRLEDERLEICTLADQEMKNFSVDYLLTAIGRQPALSYFDEDMENQAKSLVEKGKLYFIGDVKNDRYRQTAIAVGDGLLAAMDIGTRLLGG